jgi:protein TonB
MVTRPKPVHLSVPPPRFCWSFAAFQGILSAACAFRSGLTSPMLDLKTLVPKFSRDLPADPRRSADPHELKQRRLMVAALALLLVALSVVLYHDRNFWFPDTREAEDQDKDQTQPQQSATLDTSTPTQATATKRVSLARKKSRTDSPQPNAPTPADAASADAAPPMSATTTRTVLPPLEIEVVAGNVHRTIHPGTNSVHVDLQAGSPPQRISEPATVSDVTTAASVTSNAAERVQMSAGTAEVVSQPVKPGYPLLARQMKVQGSVILQALIGRDGLIQDLRVLSGPPILASAAQEAVKQWHFKPHFQGAEPVETQARITVNFTISTN